MSGDRHDLTPQQTGQVNNPLPAKFALWRRKTPLEFQRDLRRDNLRRFNPLLPVVAGIVVSVVFTGVRMLGRGGRKPEPPVDFDTAIKGMPCVFVAATAVAYLIQVLRGHLKKPQPLDICTRCHEIYVAGKDDQCACGGYLEDASYWVRT